jgi:hypothetical protein
MALGADFIGGTLRSARKDDNLTAICEPIVNKIRILDVKGLNGLLQG